MTHRPHRSPTSMRSCPTRPVRAIVLAFALSVAAAVPAVAITDLAGTTIPNTSTTSRTVQQTGSTTSSTLLGTPFAAPRPASVNSPNSPEEDLSEALATLATTAVPAIAEGARTRAVAILTGTPVADAAYSGIGLLNDNPTPATHKVKTVSANGTVVVNIVRFGEHQISDTWQLNFADPSQPFTIDYRVTELGGTDGGELTPTPLLHDGGLPIGGMHSVVADLALDETNLGTSQGSRFITALGQTTAPEHTRLATRRVVVRMPPPEHVTVILDPNLQPGRDAGIRPNPSAPAGEIPGGAVPGHDALSSLRPFDAATPGPAIARPDLAAIAPERQLWEALQTPFGADVAAANTAGAQGKSLVSAMRVKSHLPPGVAPDPAARVTIAFVNNEVYVSDTNVQLAPSANLTVTVRNADGFAHVVQGIGLTNHTPVFGATNWGRFDWERLGGDIPVPAGESRTITYAPSSKAFQLIVGDPLSGDQARAAISLDRGPIQESFRVPGPAFAFPLHDALDADGNLWVTLAGAEKIGKLTPATRLADSAYVEFNVPLPPGSVLGANVGVMEPLDIQVDPQGIVWATLAAGNAIMRLDPALAQPNTSNGIEVIPLDPCPATECRLPPPPLIPGTIPTREPTQMALRQSADGLTEVWFTELLADKIGVMKRRSDGSYVQQHFTCACKVPPLDSNAVAVPAGTPLGIDVDAAGLVWFTSANKNSIGRITPGTDPFASSVTTIHHFIIPNPIRVEEPDIGGAFMTTIPHSVAVSPDGKIWFTQQATRKVGWLDSSQASPGTSNGMHEVLIGDNEFGAGTQPADLVADPAGSVFVTDEYGDQVTMVTASGSIKERFRPTERVSLTDQPLTDRFGNLWFLEAGANLITRISGVAATRRVEAGPLAPIDPVVAVSTATDPGSSPPPDPIAAACKAKTWSFGTKAKPRVLLLGNTGAQVTSCLGKPTRKKGAVWTYAKRLRVTFKAGRVVSFAVIDKTFRAKPGNIGIGSPVSALARLSTAKVAHNKTTGRYTTVLLLGNKRGAQVRLTVVRKRITQITVTLVKTAR